MFPLADLGLSLGCRIYISDISADSVAGTDGRLQPGDVLLQVGDDTLEGLGLNKARKLLKAAKKELRIVVERESDACSEERENLLAKVTNSKWAESQSSVCPAVEKKKKKQAWAVPQVPPAQDKEHTGAGNLFPPAERDLSGGVRWEETKYGRRRATQLGSEECEETWGK